MDDERTARVFQQDQARFRRARRAELIGLALMLGVFAGAVCDGPGWPLGLGLVTVWAISFTIAFRRRWNADPPTLTFDLDEQDRTAWDAALIAEGHRLVRERLAAGVAPGRYQILAAINAVHTWPGTICAVILPAFP
jgi:predicted RNA polymerase sigma factor